MIQHINEDDAQRPDIGGTGGVSRGNIISAFIAHVGGTATIHIGRFKVGGGQTKVGKLDDDFAF